MTSFVECDTCRAKPGTPLLCSGCVSNQNLIEQLRTNPECRHRPVQPPGPPAAVQMLLYCPSCGKRHVDEGEFATKLHHTHACQKCGMVWRPAVVFTVGVLFLPGFKNEAKRA